MDTAECGKLVYLEEALNRREVERRWARQARSEEACDALCAKQVETEAKESFVSAKQNTDSKKR